MIRSPPGSLPREVSVSTSDLHNQGFLTATTHQTSVHWRATGVTEVTLGVGASFFLRHALDRTKEGMEPTEEGNWVGWKVLSLFMEVHGHATKRERKALFFLYPFHTRVRSGLRRSGEGAVRDKRGRSRVSSAWCGIKVSERKERARNGWRMVSVRGCVLFVYS